MSRKRNKKSKKSKNLIGAIIVLAILIIAVIVGIVIVNKKDDTPKSKQEKNAVIGTKDSNNTVKESVGVGEEVDKKLDVDGNKEADGDDKGKSETGAKNANGLTEEEVAYFRGLFAENLTNTSGYYIYKEVGCCDTTFALVDVNEDEKLDLIVTGPLGLRSRMLGCIYVSAGDEYVMVDLDGTPDCVYDNGLKINSPDYSWAGLEQYYSEYIFEFDKEGGYREVIRYDSFYILDYDDEIYDYASNPEYDHYFKNDGMEEITEDEYKAILNSYSGSDIEFHEANWDEIDEFIGK